MMNSEIAANNGTTVTVSKGKHPNNPTRLQKQAPANLQIDEISGNFSKKTVIPFLSPLVLSPDPNSPEVVVVTDDSKRSFANSDTNHAIGIIPQSGGGGGGDSGWKHPAMAGLPVADGSSSLYAYFHSQCTIVPRNR